ncbi:MAG: COG1361 S-layer family protein [Candidatus Woesearchaeota archaeon]
MKLNKIITIMMLALFIIPASALAQTNQNPLIKLSIANYEPMPVQPGQFVDVWINVQNLGSGDARDIKIRYLESPFFTLVNPDEQEREIPILGAYKDNMLKYRFKVADNVVEGQNQIRFEYELKDSSGVATTNLNIEIKSTEVPISISSVRITPDPVEPGERADLVIAVTNPSLSSNIRDVSLTMQLATNEGNAPLNLPFAPVDSTNKKSINRIQPGQTTEFRFNIITYPDAESKIYKVPVTFTYFDDAERQYQDTNFISINVNSQPNLYAIIESISVDTKMRTGDVIFDIINQGISDIKLLTVELDETENMKLISSTNKEYLGNLESDDFKSARYKIRIDELAEDVTFNLKLTFRDALNNEFTETLQIQHELQEPQTNGGNSTIIVVLIIIFAIIGIIIYRRRAKRKKLMQEEDD